MKFRSDEDGFITALRFYKQPNNTGTHVGHLWSGTGQLLAAATFTGETASGWQQVELPNPVPDHQGHHLHHLLLRDLGPLRVQPRLLQPGRRPLAAARSDRHGRRRQRRLPLRRERLPRPDLQRDQLLGRRGLRPHDPAGHARPDGHGADARGRRLRRPGHDRGHGHLRRAARPGDRHRHQRHAPRRGRQPGPGGRQLRRADPGREAAAPVGARQLGDLPRPAQGRLGRRHRRRGQPAHRRQDLVVHRPRRSRPAMGPGGPIQVITDPADPFGRYYAEILRAEGLNEFDVTDGPVTAAKLAGHSVVILASRVGHRRRGGAPRPAGSRAAAT